MSLPPNAAGRTSEALTRNTPVIPITPKVSKSGMSRILRMMTGVLLLIGLSSCSNESKPVAGPEEPELISVSLALNWLPEAEHGGFYAALLDGTYRDAGFDVEILPGGPDSPVIQRVAMQRVTFGISNSDRILMARSQGAEIVALMAPLQHSPRCIVVHKKSGIESFDQLKNVTLGMSDAPAFSHFMRKNLPLEGVQVVRNPGSLGQFLQDEKFAQQGYVFSEPIVAQAQGVETNALLVSELGFDPYSSVLFTSAEVQAEHPEWLEKFAAASIQGWKSYLANPDPVHDHLGEINPEMPREVLDQGLEALKSLCETKDGAEFGNMTPDRWGLLESQLVELGLCEAGVAENVIVPLPETHLEEPTPASSSQ